MATYSGVDAFWVERVRKEVKTQMRHQEEHDIVDQDEIEDFYDKVRGMQANMIGTGRSRFTPTSGLGQKHKTESAFNQHRSTTPKNVTVGPFKSKEAHLKMLKQKRAMKQLDRESVNRSISTEYVEDNVPTPLSKKASVPFIKKQASSYRDFLDNGDSFYNNQTIPFQKKVVGGEAAYEQARQRVTTYNLAKRPATQLTSSGKDFHKKHASGEQFHSIKSKGSRNNLFDLNIE